MSMITKGISIKRDEIDSADVIEYIKGNKDIVYISIVDDENSMQGKGVALRDYDKATNREKIAKVLRVFGAVASHNGYNYLIDAIEIVINSNAVKDKGIVKIYGIVGEQYDKNSSRVERCIRAEVQSMCEKFGVDDICRKLGFTGYNKDKQKEYICNSEFIYMVAEYILRRM